MLYLASLESHPALHYAVVLLFYNVGQGAAFLASAYIATKSQLNSIRSIRQYFSVRWVPVLIRWLACLAAFLFAWGNPSVLNLERWMPNLSAHLGVAWLLGFCMDQLFDKIIGIIFPGITKELPVVPTDVSK